MSEMSGSEALIESLRVEGIKHLFGIVGSAYIDALDLTPKAGIRFVGVRHEQSAAHMADAYARLTNAPGVCVVQNGPGATNLVTGIAAAYHAHSPVVAVTPSPLSSQLFTDAYQEANHVAIFSSITKWASQVNRADRIPEFMRVAFRAAMSGSKGPVLIDIPRDFFYELVNVDIFEATRYREMNIGSGDPAAIERIAERLIEAESPVIIAGGGVLWSQCANDLLELAELLTIPVVTSYGHNDAVSTEHALALGSLGRGGSKAAMEICSKADLVLAAGTRIGQFTSLPYYDFQYLTHKSRIIQIDIDPRQIGRYFPVEIGLSADLRLALRAIVSSVQSKMERARPTHRTRTNEIERARNEWQREIATWMPETHPIKPQFVYKIINEVIPRDAIVTLDLGSLTGFAYSLLAFPERRLIAPLGFGNVGFGYPAGLGAKIAKPEKTVVSIVGDGAFSMSIHEVMTAVQEDIATVCLILNNSAWGAEKANQMYFYGKRYIGTNLVNPDFAAIARCMGAYGERIDEVDEIKPSIIRALEQDKPAILDIMVDPNELSLPARRDALKEPVRMIYR
ncbi:MAG: sulfoacetaldehyde acetyltransferase [Deltaproteobacteria bacterium]|nr:sulfoacetaldehyde acetyltransferase [Deltaproteobacteria bacterium]